MHMCAEISKCPSERSMNIHLFTPGVGPCPIQQHDLRLGTGRKPQQSSKHQRRFVERASEGREELREKLVAGLPTHHQRSRNLFVSVQGVEQWHESSRKLRLLSSTPSEGRVLCSLLSTLYALKKMIMIMPFSRQEESYRVRCIYCTLTSRPNTLYPPSV